MALALNNLKRVDMPLNKETNQTLICHNHFQTNTLGKGMNPLILPSMGQIVPLLFFKVNDFGVK